MLPSLGSCSITRRLSSVLRHQTRKERFLKRPLILSTCWTEAVFLTRVFSVF
uniref:Uncharacterized protein n=1 Tax=Brassica campestris TaxID=3711 RepID=A0A3P5ZGD7_BRACM|nr:unnamed protein product [Brassica rapa]